MNYLAHVYLADNKDEKNVLGNFFGDFVNVTTEKSFEDAIRKGIHMHRRIDSYTDAHPVFSQSRTRVSPPNRRFAGVLMDIFYDHFLAKNWPEYSETPLEKYADNFYRLLTRNVDILPDQVNGMLPFMIQENWFVYYGELPGIKKPLERIARRFAQSKHPLANPIDELLHNYNDLEKDFKAFFPQVIRYANQLKAI